MTMPSHRLTIRAAAGAFLLAAVAASVHFVYASQERHEAAPAAKAATPGLLTFAPDAPQLASLAIAAVHSDLLPVAEPVNGRIVYDENRTARISAPVAGRVLSLRAEAGDAVRQGAVLALIDAPDLAAAQADLSKARADEQHKRLAQVRAQQLFDGEVLPRKDLESAEADLNQASAETRRAAQRLQNLQASGNDGAQLGLRAPLAGMVAERQINPGQEVRPDLPAPLFVVSDLHQLWVLVDVPEHSAGAVHAGQAVTLQTDAYPGQSFAAKVERVGLALDPVTHRVTVRCTVDNPELRLKPEMFVRVAFAADEGGARAVALPNSSLFTEGRYEHVFVETRPGTFMRRRVHVALRGQDASYVDQGVADGERVVTAGAFLLNAEDSTHAQ